MNEVIGESKSDKGFGIARYYKVNSLQFTHTCTVVLVLAVISKWKYI